MINESAHGATGIGLATAKAWRTMPSCVEPQEVIDFPWIGNSDNATFVLRHQDFAQGGWSMLRSCLENSVQGWFARNRSHKELRFVVQGRRWGCRAMCLAHRCSIQVDLDEVYVTRIAASQISSPYATVPSCVGIQKRVISCLSLDFFRKLQFVVSLGHSWSMGRFCRCH